MERVTDDQFAVVDGKVRHVPGGVDEYLRLLDARSDARAEAKSVKAKVKQRADSGSSDESGVQHEPALSNAEQRSLKKELASTERKLDTLGRKADAIRVEMRETDPSDYVALGDVHARIHDAEREISDLEDEWVRLSERLS